MKLISVTQQTKVESDKPHSPYIIFYSEQNFWKKQKFCHRIFLLRNFLVKTIFNEKKNVGKKCKSIKCDKNYIGQKKIGEKICWSKKNLGKKKLLVKKKLVIKLFGRKKIWVLKNFWSKRVMVKKKIFFLLLYTQIASFFAV